MKDHYLAENPETYRKLYAEKAMPTLKLEEKTPIETKRTIQEQAARIEKLEQTLKEQQRYLQGLVALLKRFNPDELRLFIDRLSIDNAPALEQDAKKKQAEGSE